MRRACLRKPYWVLCIQGIGWLLSRRREFLRIFSLFIPLSWFLFFVFYPLTSSRASFFLRPYFARALDWVLYYFSNPCFPIAGGIAYEQCYHHPQLFLRALMSILYCSVRSLSCRFPFPPFVLYFAWSQIYAIIPLFFTSKCLQRLIAAVRSSRWF